MRYELSLSRYKLSASLVVTHHLCRYRWHIKLSSDNSSLSQSSPRLFKHPESALYSALRAFKPFLIRLDDGPQKLLLLWLKQVFTNAWLHVPLPQRLSLLADDLVKPSPRFIAMVNESRQSADLLDQPMSQGVSNVALMGDAGMRTRMCPLSLDLAEAS